jgi:hypothetical protein
MFYTEEEARRMINQMREDFLVHSYIYYRLGLSVISDNLFDARCRHLDRLHKHYPEIAETCNYQDYFKDFNPATGMDIPDIPHIIEKANKRVREYREMVRKWRIK